MAAIFRPIKPVKWFSQIVSLWPYGRIGFKSLDALYGVVLLAVNVISVMFYYVFFTQDQTARNKIVLANELICLFLLCLLTVTVLSTGFVNHKAMMNILRDFTIVDQELNMIGVDSDIRGTNKFQACLITMTVIANLPLVYCITLFNNVPIWEATYENYAYSVTTLQMSTVPMLFTAFAHILKRRFHSINVQLKQLLHELSTQPAAEVLMKLQKLVNVHITMRGIVQEINSAFSLLILLFIGHTVAESSLSLLAVLQSLDSEVTRLESWQMILFCYFIVKGLGLILTLTETCQGAALEANKSVLLVHRLHQPNTDITIMKEIEIFSLGMIRNYVTFSAGGFLDVDRGLMTKVCITVTTYLVISLQIKDFGYTPTTTALSIVDNVTNSSYI